MEYYGMHDLQSSEQLCITWPTIMIAEKYINISKSNTESSAKN